VSLSVRLLLVAQVKLKMKKYQVLVRGENFLIDLDGECQKVGFYTTRFVEAEDEEGAELAAMDALRGDPKLTKGVLNAKTDPPLMYAEEVEEVGSFEGLPAAGMGFAFYPQEEQ
jgi:hypothetical protein